MGELVVGWVGGLTNTLVQIGFVTAKILLIWTLVIRKNVGRTNVTVTAGILSRSSVRIGLETANIEFVWGLLGGWV